MAQSADESPAYFYRYTSIDEVHPDHSRRIFTDNELYFSTVDAFNDPFDCRFRYELKGSKADLAKWYDGVQREHYPSRNRQERRLETAQWLKEIKAPGYEEERQQRFREEEMPKWGIYCLSEIRDNILMWAHYANGHRGFCLKFLNDTNDRFCAKRRPDDPDPDAKSHPNIFPLPVDYCSEYPVINQDSDLETWVQKGLLTKAAQWQYEKEWRLFDLNGRGVRKFPSQFLTGVIFGCEMSKDHKGMIHEWCKDRQTPIKYYEAQRAANAYALNIVPVYPQDRNASWSIPPR